MKIIHYALLDKFGKMTLPVTVHARLMHSELNSKHIRTKVNKLYLVQTFRII